MHSKRSRLLIEKKSEDVTIVKFRDRKLLDEQNIQLIGEELFAIADAEKGRTQSRAVVLDFSNVEFMVSTFLDKLKTLRTKLLAKNDEIVLTGIHREIQEVFTITKWDKLFGNGYKPNMTGEQAAEAAIQNGRG